MTLIPLFKGVVLFILFSVVAISLIVVSRKENEK